MNNLEKVLPDRDLKEVITMTDTYTFEVLVEGLWLSASLCSIKQGETFRMFNCQGEPVSDPRGYSVWTATHDKLRCS